MPVGWAKTLVLSSLLKHPVSPSCLESLSQGLAPGRPWRNICGMVD